MLDTQTGSNFMAEEDVFTSEWKWADTNDRSDETSHNDSTMPQLKHCVSPS